MEWMHLYHLIDGWLDQPRVPPRLGESYLPQGDTEITASQNFPITLLHSYKCIIKDFNLSLTFKYQKYWWEIINYKTANVK